MSNTRGSDFAAGLSERVTPEREERLVEAVRNGLHLPLTWVELTVRSGAHQATFFVLDDAVRIGIPGDSFRINVTARGQQRIADTLGASLPTAELVEAAYDQGFKVSPCPLPPDAAMANTSRMLRHSRTVDEKLGARTGLVAANVGKHWVLHPRLQGLVVQGAQGAANFGWFQSKARPYRPIQTLGLRHNWAHVDYSQICWLVRRDVIVDGNATTFAELLADPVLHRLASAERCTFSRLPVEPSSPVPTPVRNPEDPAAWPILQRGSRGPEVQAWQRRLIRDGHSLGPAGADGKFGSMTHEATVAWQRAHGLLSTGIVGESTVAFLLSRP